MLTEHVFTTLIDVKSLAGLLETAVHGRLVLLDCRFDLANPRAGREAYLASHLPGAHFADLNADLSAPVSGTSGRHPLPSPDAATAFFGTAGIGAAGIGTAPQVVAYDAGNGSLAARAWWLLRWLGFARVAVLDGGFAAWVAAGGPLETAFPATSSVRFTPRPDSQPVCTASAVDVARVDPAWRVIDARAPERFAGRIEPIDPVPGHVPGAFNHPFTDNLGADGRFLPAAELKARWLARLGCVPPSRSIMMCGSGVTACHNLLSLEVAGMPGAALYAGSWSEWIRDPARPVAAGDGEEG